MILLTASIPGSALANRRRDQRKANRNTAGPVALVALASAGSLIGQHDSAKSRPETRRSERNKENQHDH